MLSLHAPSPRLTEVCACALLRASCAGVCSGVCMRGPPSAMARRVTRGHRWRVHCHLGRPVHDSALWHHSCWPFFLANPVPLVPDELAHRHLQHCEMVPGHLQGAWTAILVRCVNVTLHAFCQCCYWLPLLLHLDKICEPCSEVCTTTPLLSEAFETTRGTSMQTKRCCTTIACTGSYTF